MDERLIQMLGESIINIAEEWKELSAEDLMELREFEATKVFCVYENWSEFTKYYIEHDALEKIIPDYLIKCIDFNKAVKYLSESLKDDYTELSSGKIVQFR